MLVSHGKRWTKKIKTEVVRKMIELKTVDRKQRLYEKKESYKQSKRQLVSRRKQRLKL